jgi:hypothetical protein
VEDQLKYLFPKPLADYAPLLLFGFALAVVLYIAIDNQPLQLTTSRWISL